MEQPEAFVVVGKLDSDVAVEEDLGITPNDDEDDNDIPNFDMGEEFKLDRPQTDEEPSEEETDEETSDVSEEPKRNYTRSGGRRASNLNREMASKEIPQGNRLAENKVVEDKSKLIRIENFNEVYTIDPVNKTYTIKTAKGEKTFTFDEMNEFVKEYRGINRIYKPMSVLAYTDYKNGSLRNWNVVSNNTDLEEAKSKKVPTAIVAVQCSADENDIVNIAVKGTSKITNAISEAIVNDFDGMFTSDINNKVYAQDIKVAQDLWLTFVNYDEKSNTLNYVLDGDISQDSELTTESKALDESVTSKEYENISVALENASSIEEIQDIIHAVSDETVEDEMQSVYNACLDDNDDLDTVKSLMMTIFEDNVDIEE